jgi:hypothetical protein
MNQNDEARLRALFLALRRSDHQEAPEFHALISKGHNRSRARAIARRRTPASIGAAVAAAALGALILSSEAHQPAEQMEDAEMLASIMGWRPASDILLNVPGRQLLVELPDLKVSTLPTYPFDARTAP